MLSTNGSGILIVYAVDINGMIVRNDIFIFINRNRLLTNNCPGVLFGKTTDFIGIIKQKLLLGYNFDFAL